MRPYHYGPEIIVETPNHQFGFAMALSTYDWSERNATVFVQLQSRKTLVTGAPSIRYLYRDEEHNVAELTEDETIEYIELYESYVMSIYDEVKQMKFMTVAIAIHSIIGAYRNGWRDKLANILMCLDEDWSLPIVKSFGSEHFDCICEGMNELQISDALIRSKIGEIPPLGRKILIAS